MAASFVRGADSRMEGQLGLRPGPTLAGAPSAGGGRDAAALPSENPHPILRIAASGTILYANPACAGLLERWRCRVGQRAPRRWWDLAASALRSGSPATAEVSLEDGAYSFALVPVVAGGYVNLYGTDVTEGRRAGQALRESEKRYRRLFNAQRDAVIVLDGRTGRFVDVNEAALGLYGYSREELLALRYADIWAGGEPAGGAGGQAPGGQSGMTFHDCHRNRSGTVFPVEISRGEFALGGRRVVCLMVRDITEGRRQQEQLRQAAKMEAVGRLAGGIAHDFNNILAIIQGYADMLAQSLPAADDRSKDVRHIRDAARRATGLTGQLLAFGRKQAGSPRPLRLGEVVASMESMLRRMLGEDVELVIAAAGDPWWVLADATQMEEVVLNLAANARKAMPRGGRLSIEIANTVLEERDAAVRPGVTPGEYVTLSVTDTGIGMSEEIKRHVFEPFFTTAEVGEGTGLGLTTCQAIVTHCGGHIEVDSRPGEGATFRVRLPRTHQRAAGAGRPAAAEPAMADGLPGGDETILLAEDDHDVRQLIARVLRGCGYTVLEAGNAREAIPLGEHYDGPIHLLLTDIVMPEMSGIELADRLACAREGMRAVCITARADDGRFREGPPDGFSGVLGKPFSLAALAETVRRALDAAPANAPARR